MTLHEVDEAANRIREEVDADANIIFGSTFDATMQGRMRVSVVSTGISAMAAQQPAPNYLSLDMNRPMQTGQPALSRPAAPPVGRVAMPAAAAAAPRRCRPRPSRRRRSPCAPPAPPPAPMRAAPVAAAPDAADRWRRCRPRLARSSKRRSRRRSMAAAGRGSRRSGRPAPCAGSAHRRSGRRRTCAGARAAAPSGRWSTRTTGASAARRPRPPVRATEPVTRPVAARVGGESRAPNLFQRITGAFSAEATRTTNARRWPRARPAATAARPTSSSASPAHSRRPSR